MKTYTCPKCKVTLTEKELVQPNSLPWMHWYKECPHCKTEIT